MGLTQSWCPVTTPHFPCAATKRSPGRARRPRRAPGCGPGSHLAQRGQRGTLRSSAGVVGCARLIGDVCAFPRALSFSLCIKRKILLFLVCRTFRHLLCLGRVFAENISSSLIPMMSGGFGSLRAGQQRQLASVCQAPRQPLPWCRAGRCCGVRKSHLPTSQPERGAGVSPLVEQSGPAGGS